MDHFIRLEALPPGLVFPPEFTGRISYDVAGHRLVFHGFMSKADFDRLCRLSDDWTYRRQLEELFRLCTPEAETPRRGLFAKLFSHSDR
jgi:hypothetical protein